MEITHNNLPEAISLLLSKIESIEKLLQENSNIEVETGKDKLLTMQEASLIINLSIPTIYNYVHRKEIPFYKRSRKIYFIKQELIDWIKSAKRKTVSEIANEINEKL